VEAVGTIVHATENSRTWRLPCTLPRMKITTSQAAGKSLPGPRNSRFEPIPKPALRNGVTAMSSVAIALLQK
jgi:hypothetical protein